MKKIFISQPMRGRTNEEILQERKCIVNEVEQLFDEPIEVLDTVFEDFDGATPLKYLAKSIMVLADADIAYFVDGWKEARGCVMEHICAKEYEIATMYEKYDEITKEELINKGVYVYPNRITSIIRDECNSISRFLKNNCDPYTKVAITKEGMELSVTEGTPYDKSI